MRVSKFSYALVILMSGRTLAHDTDINIVGFARFSNGLGRVTTSIIDCLSRELTVKFINTRPAFTSTRDIEKHLDQIIKSKTTQTSSKVSLLTDNIWLPDMAPYKHVPPSAIKLAYSMCESTKIPQPWVSILNAQFDAVIVPDEFFVSVYENSGVTIPVFTTPLALYLEDFLNAPLKNQAHKPFVFGVSAALSKNKNIELLIKAFGTVYKNNKNVILKIHSQWNNQADTIHKLIQSLGLENVFLSTAELSWKKYIEFMQSLDCYVLVSRGEGFSITCREAMALGLPCILSDNTAHKTVCKTGLVWAVPSNITQLSDREFYQTDVGYNFNCRQEDIQIALESIYNNYSTHLQTAQLRRDWTKQYLRENIAPLFSTLAKPKKVIWGQRNEVAANYLMTTSEKLYKKYITILREN